mmetsp:Transcript_57485/g.134770  ORF Transcript_57485/g.134770 Transcript_57485/m.134770 type:complete len:83 (-) Transcript_57485:126-374(-)|eukprot:3249341-Amphidinium_carterae.1
MTRAGLQPPRPRAAFMLAAYLQLVEMGTNLPACRDEPLCGLIAMWALKFRSTSALNAQLTKSSQALPALHGIKQNLTANWAT